MSLRFLAMLTIFMPVALVTALRKPRWGLYILIGMYYFRPGIWHAPSWFQPVYWTTLACMVGWAVRARDLRVSASLVLSVLFILSMIISSYAARVDRSVSLDTTVVVVKLVAVQFLVVQLLRSIEHIKQFLWANVLTNVWTLKTVLVLTITRGPGTRIDVSVGQGGGANYLAMVFVMGLPLFYFRFLHGTSRERKIAMVLAPLHLLAVIGTGSRGGFLTMFAIFVYLIMHSRKKVEGLALLGLLGIIFAIAVPQSTWQRFMTTFEGGSDRGFAAQSRIELWKASLRMFSESPITGVGHDNFSLLSPRYTGFFAGDTPRPYDKTKEGEPGYRGFVAHSNWFQSLADGGLIGSIPFFGLFVLAFYTLRRVRKLPMAPDDHGEISLYSNIIEGMLWAYCIASSFGSHMKFDFLWWFFGAISVLGIIAREKAAAFRREHAERVLQARAENWAATAPART